ncbi:hypothetical protein D3C71_1829030 [compost metagenome]
MSRVHVEAIARVTREQRLGRCAKFVFLFGEVLAGDDQTRFFIAEWIRTERVAVFEIGRERGQATGVGRNAAIGVASFVRADGGQSGAKFRGLVGTDSGVRRACHGQSQRGGQYGFDEIH